MPRIAIVAHTFSQTSETFIAHHARSLAPGHTALVCMEGQGAERFGHPVLSHVKPAYVPPGPVRGLRARLEPALRRAQGYGSLISFDDRLRIAEFFRSQDVAVVLAEFGGMGVVVMDVCAELDLPLYVYFRGHDATATMQFASMRRFCRRMFRQVEGVFAVSRFIADRLVAVGCPEKKLHVNPSGADLDQFQPSAREPGRVLSVGRLVETKAPLTTLRAFARVAPRFPQARLDLVGDGPLRGEVADEIARLGIADRVTLHGALDHAGCAALMRRASIFALHSVTDRLGTTEGFPTAIAEALASAVPVVSTRHAGIPEHVIDGETGRLVDEGDEAGMAQAFADLLADPATGAVMGDAGRLRAQAHLTRARSDALLRRVMDLDARLGIAAGGRDDV
jgi:colanic acid/amylovoran biosynthesis glycosyltransferase